MDRTLPGVDLHSVMLYLRVLLTVDDQSQMFDLML